MNCVLPFGISVKQPPTPEVINLAGIGLICDQIKHSGAGACVLARQPAVRTERGGLSFWICIIHSEKSCHTGARGDVRARTQAVNIKTRTHKRTNTERDGRI